MWIRQNEKRILCFCLAVVIAMTSTMVRLPDNIIVQAAENSVRQKYGNLLDGLPFDFFGKNDRTSIHYWMDSSGRPAYCIEPTKRMTSGTLMATFYANSEEEMPIGVSQEQYELLGLAMLVGNNSGGINRGTYISTQAAIWAILSGDWEDIDYFEEQMEELYEHITSRDIETECRNAVAQFSAQVRNFSGNGSMFIPSWAAKFEKDAPTIQMVDEGDWWVSRLDISDCPTEVKDFEFHQLPGDWPQPVIENNQVVFRAPKTFVGTMNVKGVVKPDSNLYPIPSKYKLGYLIPSDNSKQAMLVSSMKLEPWSCYLRLSTREGTIPETESGYFTLESHRYRHDEIFKSNYKIELVKKDAETGKELEGAVFEILEAFDASLLDPTSLQRKQFDKEPGSLTVCASVMTDEKGHIQHMDQKSYQYSKTYCGGHPDPEIHYAQEVTANPDAPPEELAAVEEANEKIQEENAKLEEEAWAAWEADVEACEEECDFHDIEEGVAEERLRRNRDRQYQEFINLEYDYTVKETKARPGYILHDLHGDDEPVEIVRFASSQAGGQGRVIGYYHSGIDGEGVAASVVPLQLDRVMAGTATASDSEQQPDTLIATPSNGSLDSVLSFPQSQYSLSAQQKYARSLFEEEEGTQGWDGEYENSEVALIRQAEYDKNHTGFHFVVYDHRTEGEFHINKRDRDLYLQDPDNSYGMTQGEATLEGAVYGLYAAEDIFHPDGKTGKVFSSNELVALATTDKNGDASFLCITEVSDTSKQVPNLCEENRTENGNQWIGRPLLLGSYYVKEVSRSEGYELSVEGKELTESNRQADYFSIAESGSVTAGPLSHRLNEWDGSWNEFTVQYYRTVNGYEIEIHGYPKDSVFSIVERKTGSESRQVINGNRQEPKRGEDGAIVYVKAKGGEHKYDREGNWLVKRDEKGEIVYDQSSPIKEQFSAGIRLNYYPSGQPEPVNGERYEEPADGVFIAEETNALLAQIGFKEAKEGYPAMRVVLHGTTNGELIQELLDACGEDPFWDSYFVERVTQDNGGWVALIRYAYTGLPTQKAIYDPLTDRLVVRRPCMIQKEEGIYDGFCYLTYDAGTFSGTERVTAEKRTVKEPVIYGEEAMFETEYLPEYEFYSPGEVMVDQEGNPIPEMETVYTYTTVTEEVTEEELTPLSAKYDEQTGIYHLYMPNQIEWEEGTAMQQISIRAAAPTSKFQDRFYADYLLEQGAFVNVTTTKPVFSEGSYVKQAVLLYAGQDKIYQDNGTREKPDIVLQRVIRQAVKVTKDIAQSSYEDINTYRIHRDPFTVLYGGYRGQPGTKTLKNFTFRIYALKDLEATNCLERDWNGTWDYRKFLNEHPDMAESLALECDSPKQDRDGDLTTIQAFLGSGVDDYYATSVMLPYGRYLIVEVQPKEIPNKHYQIDYPKEITIPYVPEMNADGTIHPDKPSVEYFYDARMSAEEMMKRYHIRFQEETHVIKAHNHDGDFEVYKFGLEPGMKHPYPNDRVAQYYKYSSTSEEAGKKDGVYYSIYYDREGHIVDYGVTLNGVDTMSGISTVVDRQYAPALVPWSILDPRYSEEINDEGTIGNREPGIDKDGHFNFVSFVQEDFENHFYGSKLRIEKVDSETGENIIHDGALFRIYAAKRDISGETGEIKGTGNVLFHPDGTPQYDETEQIFMRDETGAEVGIFKAYSTIRDGDVETENGKETQKTGVGYIETYQPLGAGAYVLVEVEAPPGYVKSKPIAFEIYSDQVTYYHNGDQSDRREAKRYQYMVPLKQPKVIDVAQIYVENKPSRIELHKVEAGDKTFEYRVTGDEAQLKKRGDVELKYLPNGEFAGYGYARKYYDVWSRERVQGTEEDLKAKGTARPIYGEDGTFTGEGISYKKRVGKATLTLYQALEVKRTGAHRYDGVEVTYNMFQAVTDIRLTKTGRHSDIQTVGKDDKGNLIWDIEEEENPSVSLWRFDLKYDPTEFDLQTGILYGLDEAGNRICKVDSETGMAYVEDDKGRILVWPLNDDGEKIETFSIVMQEGKDGTPNMYMGLEAKTDEQGLPIYYVNGGPVWEKNEWVTSDESGHEITRIPFGAYIVEETAAPNSQGYVRSMAAGFIVEETSDPQHFFVENDFTKAEISKIDLVTREEIPGAQLTLYEAYRVADGSPKGWHLETVKDSYGEERIYARWISGLEYDDRGDLKLDAEGKGIPTKKPHWIDHIPPGDYILTEIQVPYEMGYVRSDPVELTIQEDGGIVQGAVMEDDHTALEILKIDKVTGQPIGNENPATLALYEAVTNELGEVIYEDGHPCYHEDRMVVSWETNDGKEVAATGHEILLPGGHTSILYDYDAKPVEGTGQAYCYVTEKGAMHFEYLPVGAYVLVEEKAPEGMATADPMAVRVLELGSRTQVQTFVMEDSPITVDVDKENGDTRLPLRGAVMAVYRADSNGNLREMPLIEGGRPIYVTDQEGNLVVGPDGKPIPEMICDPAYLWESWISGSDGIYTPQDRRKGLIPEGRRQGDLKPHRLTYLPTGIYYLVELSAPYGFVRNEAVRFVVTDQPGVQTVKMENWPVKGVVELLKTDKEQPKLGLSGAKYQISNLETGETQILITGENGRAVSGELPIGAFDEDGALSLYHYRLEEIESPENYMKNPEAFNFQFCWLGDRVPVVTYQAAAADLTNRILISKKDLTTQEELPGAVLEIRRVETIPGDLEESLPVEGEVLETWISGTKPHLVKNLPAGQYVLIETAPPTAGYSTANPLYFEIRDNQVLVETLEMFDQPTQVDIYKVDGETKSPLAGARLRLSREGELLREWETTLVPEHFTALEPGFYLLEELEAPEGYCRIEPVELEVRTDWEPQIFEIENFQIQIEISKKDEKTGECLEGALLQLSEKESGLIVEEWISTEEPRQIKGLPAGTYILSETAAPTGYQRREPMEITVEDTKEIQTFVYFNARIEREEEHTPKPEVHYGTIGKIDGNSGHYVAGMEIEIYRQDGSLYFKGATDERGILRFVLPPPGDYTFQETRAPEGYYRNETIFSFTVTKDGVYQGERLIKDYRIPRVEIHKIDAASGLPVSGASIGIFSEEGEPLYSGVTDQEGRLYYEPPKPGVYHFKELEAPYGYQLNQEEKTFIVSWDGKISGELTLQNERQIGRIIAFYQSGLWGKGNYRFHQLGRLPGTGDREMEPEEMKKIECQPSFLMLMAIGAMAAIALAIAAVRHKKGRLLLSITTLLLSILVTLAAYAPPVFAAAEFGEPVVKEQQYETTDPDERHAFPEKWEDESGRRYQLDEVTYHLVEEREDPWPSDYLTIRSRVFLTDPDQSQKPENVYYSTVSGQEYQLRECSLVEEMIPEHSITADTVVSYVVEALDEVPETAQVNVVDENTGQEVMGILPLADWEMDGERWEDDFRFQVIYKQYGSEWYLLGDTLVSAADAPQLDGYESLLLGLIGAGEEEYQIEGIAWSTDPYVGTDGHVYRDASAWGRKKVADCRARYQGEVTFPEEQGLCYEALYQKTELIENPRKCYTIKAEATYFPVGSEYFWWDRLHELIRPLVGGTAILLLLVFIVLAVKRVARERKEGTMLGNQKGNRVKRRDQKIV